VSELTVLQAVRLKGRVSRDDLAATLGGDFVDVVDGLVGSGLLLDGPALRLSPEGRGRLEGLLADEWSHVDAAAVSAAYSEFRSVNAESRHLSPIGSSRTAGPTHTTTPATTRRYWPVSTMCIGG
jgi:hypothetical protein